MKNFALTALALALLLCTPGCATWAAKDQLAITTAGSDGYAALTVATLDGSLDPALGKVVTSEELGQAPESVRELLGNLITALWKVRVSLHQLDHVVNDGTHPGEIANPEAPVLRFARPADPPRDEGD